MKILAIDTSCDETSAAITEGTKILSNVIWSQASAHAKFGGVMPSLAQRMHKERIDWVVNQAIKKAGTTMENVDAVAVTIGPGLSIALAVGIDRAKKIAGKYKKPIISVNHLEGHILSSLANTNMITNIKFPSLGLVISGGNTILVKINKIGSYDVLAQTTDDALGEALDKGARMLGLGYPGGAILERFARGGGKSFYKLPVPIVGHEDRKIFTYSGVKTAFSRLVESQKPLTKTKIENLAASFQNVAFEHLIRISSYIITHSKVKYGNLFVGGGVSANIELRKGLRKLCRGNGIKVLFPSLNKLTGDNAAMIGIAAYFKSLRGEYTEVAKIDLYPNLRLN